MHLGSGLFDNRNLPILIVSVYRSTVNCLNVQDFHQTHAVDARIQQFHEEVQTIHPHDLAQIRANARLLSI